MLNKSGVAILISGNIDLEQEILPRAKQHYVMIKRSIQQEDITILNVTAPNNRDLKYIK